MTTFTDVLNNIRPTQAAAPVFLTDEQVQAWTKNPETLTDEQHQQGCSGGWVQVQDARDLSGWVSMRCPRCEAEQRRVALRRQLTDSGIDGRYLDVGWSDLDVVAPLDRVEKACQRISDIVATGQSVLLWSPETGTGKTQAAMLAATAAIQAGHSAFVANLARIAVDVRDGYNRKGENLLTEAAALRRLAAPDVLVLDDLGAGETDSAAVERRLLFLALDERQTRRRPTIVTSNLSPDMLVQTFGTRFLGRLQPLTIIAVNHKKNFRVNKSAEGLW